MTANRVIRLEARDEAERLWSGARQSRDQAESSLVDLCQALDLGVRAAEILVGQKLQPQRHDWPATIELLLEPPPPAVDRQRDSTHLPRTLQFIHVLDMLSADGLDCVSPDLHRGWEDRRFSCQRSRERARAAVGVTLDAAGRDRLLLLCAYRNRLFRMHPPVEVVVDDVVAAWPALEELVGKLGGG
jgi:hypothetical protein